MGVGLLLLSTLHRRADAPISCGGVAWTTLTQVTSETEPTDDILADADVPDGRDLADIPAGEVISRAAVLLMSAAAEQLGLAADDPQASPHRDLDQARALITALAGLVSASAPDLGPHAAAFRDGLKALQAAFREYSIHPDEPGYGPGEGRRVPHA